MTARPIIGLILALLLSFVLGGAVVWIVTDARTTPASPPTAPYAKDSDHHSRAEKFFGGDPDRNVRGGQEMKPRW